jgi:chorismate mutase-like protein
MSTLARLCLVFLIAAATPAALADGTLYLVRHAEKALDGGPDPALTALGQDRAASIANMLKTEAVTAVYSTDYARTRDTAEPAARQAGVPVTLYDPKDLRGLADMLKAARGAVLVVGHSNTTPVLANLIAGTDFRYAGEDVYDLVYIIRTTGGQPKGVSIRYSSPQQDHSPKTEALRRAVADRLAVMTDVAHYKWAHRLPIEVPKREARVIEDAVARAAELDLDEYVARRAMTAQMAASREWQQQLFSHWDATGKAPAGDIPALTDKIRPEIDRQTDALLTALAQAEFATVLCSQRAVLKRPMEGVDPAVWKLAISGLYQGSCVTEEAAVAASEGG